MLMVLNLHCCWCFDACTGLHQAVDVFREATSICAVDCFLIISGYFGIKWKIKSFWNLMFQLFFYSFGVYIVAVGLGVIDFTVSGLSQCAKATYASWGFISGYVALYFVAPLINAFVEKSTNRELLCYIVAFLAAAILICRSSDNVFLYLQLYMVGRLIRKADIVSRIKVSPVRGYWLMTVIIFCASYALYMAGILTTAEAQVKSPLALNYLNPFIILQAAFLFIVFGRMNFQSKIVNWLSASSLAIFLIHMHPAIKEIGYYAYSKSLYSQPLATYIGMTIALVVVVFFGSILIDKIRIFISDKVYGILQTIVRKTKHSESSDCLQCAVRRYLQID